ncbi:ROK family protein [Mucilaginibacter sp. RS28]|uniref:ROK family protein n=1 Tax=Mucilaginibacter straminoryzae TaxID=2932774 RepID=A0A9X1X5Z7_9SPHI|nr:ROK family transcriptional regulator [Mucilaginibacter straminoryzae]MCJ8209254.1 ROK family protein [Mucilaginibacter straminoryzae]
MLLSQLEVLKTLYYNKGYSIHDISMVTGRSIPFTTKAISELLEMGFIKEDGLRISSGGRKPATYSLSANTGFIVSVAIDQFKTRVVIADLGTGFIGETQELEINIHQKHDAIFDLVDFINQTITASGRPKERFLAIGITMPGFIDAFKGNNLLFVKSPQGTFVDFIAEKTGLPVFIENDSTAIALAEQKFGLPIAKNDSMIINLGWGIGLGMIVNQKVFKGHSGFAGEFSHLALYKNGKLCSCGKHGCLETEASLLAIEAKAIDGLKAGEVSHLSNYEHITADDIINEAIKGDAYAIKIISECAYYIGQGLAILIHLMNPESIILSGKGSVIGKIWLAPIQQAIHQHCIPHLTTYTTLAVSELGDKAQLLGGLAIVVENLDKIKDKISAWLTVQHQNHN